MPLVKSRAKQAITYDMLDSLFLYDPLSGYVFHRSLGRGKRSDFRAGTLTKDGYRQLFVSGFAVAEHRVIWVLMTKRWPHALIDHINYRKDDNRWSNLREADQKQNGQHRSGTNRTKKSKLPRCVFRARNKYRVVVGKNNIGHFSDVSAAVAARNAYESKFRGEWSGACNT